MVKRNLAKFIKLLMVSGAVLILPGIAYLTANQADTASYAKEGSMIPANKPATRDAEIPQIDIVVGRSGYHRLIHRADGKSRDVAGEFFKPVHDPAGDRIP